MEAETTEMRPSVRPHGNVRTTLNYIVDTGARQVFYNDDPHCGSLTLDPREVEIEDVSFAARPPRLDVEGFQVFRHETSLRDLSRGEESFAEPYALELEPMMREAAGADYVTLSRRQLTRKQFTTRVDLANRQGAPATFVHSDTSRAFGPTYTNRQGPPEPDRKVRRMAILKQWRLVSPGPTNLPLAMLDARTLSPDDFVPADSTLRQGEMTLEMVVLRYNPAHRWCYFSQLGYDDVLVFKQFDTDADYPWCVPHSAFANSLVTGELPPRVNYETGMAAYWYED